MSDLLRVYLDPDEIGPDGYPFAWRQMTYLMDYVTEPLFRTRLKPDEAHIRAWQEERDVTVSWDESPPIKNLIRELAQHRCERCRHPYPPRITETCPRGEWTPCDEQCSHDGPIIYADDVFIDGSIRLKENAGQLAAHARVLAQWRILTTHHLNGVKHDCRWWNLAALCQRCHLTIQSKVHLEKPYDREHTEWFKPHAAGYYASTIRMFDGGEEPTREWVFEHMDEILHEHATQGTLL